MAGPDFSSFGTSVEEPQGSPDFSKFGTPVDPPEEGALGAEGRYFMNDLKMGWNTAVKGFVHGQELNEYGGLIESFKKRYTPEQIAANPQLQTELELRQSKYREAQGKIKELDDENQQLADQSRPSYQRLQEINSGEWTVQNLANLGAHVIQNPGTIASIATQSAAPSVAMLAAGVLARFGGGSATTAAAAGGYTSHLVEFGNDYADLRKQGDSHEEAYKKALIKSSIVGVLDAVSMKSAGRALDDVMEKSGILRKAGTVAKETGRQAALGAGGEAGGMLASGRTPDPLDVLAEAVGEVAGAPVEAISTMRGPRARADNTPQAEPLPAAEVLGEEAPPAMLALPAPKPEISVDGQGTAQAVVHDAETEAARRSAAEAQRVSREDLGNTSPNAPRTDIEELRAQAVRDRDFAKLDEVNAQQAAAQKEAAFTQREQAQQANTEQTTSGLDRLADQQRRIEANAGPSQPTAMQLAMERAGVRTAQFPEQPKTEPERQLEANTARVLGGAASDLSDGLLQYVAANGQAQAQTVAQAELQRRTAIREVGPSEQDRSLADKLFERRSLTRDERHRAIELGWGHPKANGAWALSRQARAYRTQLREEKAQGVARQLGQSTAQGTHETDQALVERLNTRVASRDFTASAMPVSPDARAGVQIARSFGKRVVWVEGGKGFNGVVLPEDPNTIYVGVASERSHLVIIGHELLHTLRRTNEAVYKQLLDRVLPVMKEVPEYRAWLKQALASEGQELSASQLADLTHEELIADFMGDHMTQPKFWLEVFRGQNRSWIERTRDAIHLALDAIRIRMTIGGKRGFGTERYIKDTDAVRRAMAEAFNSWTRQATEGALKKPTTEKPATSALQSRASRPPEKPAAPVKESVRSKGVTITAETKPSTKLDIGKALESMDALKLAKYQKDALAAVFGDKGLAALRDAMGFERTKFSYVEGTGAYEESISPNIVLTIDGTINDARRLARAWMYIFKQDAVPFFRADEKLIADHKAPVGFKVNFAKAPTPEQERALYDALRQKVHAGIGYTKTGPGEFVVINFRGDNGKPFLDLTDQQLLDRMEALIEGTRLPVAVESFGAFGVQGEYPYHDWQSETTGRTLRQSAAQGRSDLQERLDRWADSFQRFAQKRGGALKPRAERPGDAGREATGDRAGAVAATAKAPPSEGLSASTDQLAHEAASSPKNALPTPTPAQKAAGNYAKGHVKIAGLDISIENPEGSTRTHARGESVMKSHYGYIRGTVGKDKDHVDIFIKPGTPADYTGPVFVIDQKKATGHFDEHKVMLGWGTMPEARTGYMENYGKGWDGIRAIVRFENPEAFKAWLEHGDTKAPVETQAPLLSRERDQTDTAAFKKWFGDSKVVDAEGKPLVVYHGSRGNENITKFDINKSEMDASERGIYFTDSAEHAHQYATQWGDSPENGSLYPSYLKIRNPYIVDALAWHMGEGLTPQQARRKGHDGFVIENHEGGTTYVAFRPEQIKTAIGNRGTFDPNDANILRSREDRPGSKFEFGLELERRPNGDWVSPDGRFEIERDPNGYYAKVDGIEIGWGRDFQKARAHLLAKFKEELKAGNIINPMEAKSVFNRYTPEQQAAVTTVWKRIASLPGVFRLGRSEAKGLQQIAEDMGAARDIQAIDGYDVNEPDGKHGWMRIDFKDGAPAVLNYFDADKTAYLNAAEMNRGGYGKQLYQMALTWAANNHYVLVPDPGGLSLTNTYRRTEQMIAAALRLGTTKYMAPHSDQGLYGWIKAPKTQSEEDHNLSLMLLTSYENVYQSLADTTQRTKVIAELSNMRYNFEHGRFEHEDGTPVKPRAWSSLAHLEQSGSVGSGITTLQRAVLTKSVLDEARNRGGKGLAALVSHVPARGLLDEDDPLRGILYSRERDSGSGPVAGAPGARPSDQAGGALRRAALGTASAAVAAARPVTGALDLLNRAADAALKLPAKLLVLPVTSRIYDRVAGIAQAVAQKSELAQEIAHGLKADYGLSEPYLDARQDRENRINKVLRQSKDALDRIASLSRAEARVAYLWMQEKPDTQAEQHLVQQLPEESRQTLAQMKEQIDQLGQEAVKLGLLSPESFDRNRMAYLHRTYKKYELENPQAVARTSQAKNIKADAYRGRGLRDDVAASRVPGAQQGDHYVRMELRDPGEGLGKLKRVVYLKAGLPIPQTYQSWRKDGTWEARWLGDDRVGMWRDLTPEERTRLGEIDEVRYAFARTMLATTRDIETARFLAWTADHYSEATEDDVMALGGRIAEAVDSMVTLSAYADNEWVQVPSGYAAGTKIRKYGALAGQYIPGHIWNDIRSTINVKSGAAVWRLYDQLLRAWKISKTALSPAVHTNNIMSNFILADMAEVGFGDIRNALKIIIQAQRGDSDAKAIMERYYDSGAESGSQSAIELRNEIIEPLLEELEREQDETLRTVGLMQALSLAARGSMRQALASALASKEAQLLGAPFKLMIEAYRSEDAVFRLAKFMKEVSTGHTDQEAGKVARKAFLDYHINAPWIQALRRGPLPFVAFSYRAIPLLIETAAQRPWKLMKYFAVGYGLNALAYSMLGSSGDEDKERKLMQDEKSGRALGVFYRMLRMPWNDEHGSPVFLDVRRWIPGGDIMDLTGSQSAIPLPSWLSVGGPLSLFVELAANKSLFTGKAITKESNTLGENIVAVADHLFKFSAPNLPLPTGAGWLADALGMDKRLFQTYSWANIRSAATGETDAFGRERNLAQAAASSVGVKLSAQPEDVAKQNLIHKRDAQTREIGETMGDLRRQFRRDSITDEEYAQRREQQNEKKREVAKKFNERIGLEYR